MSKANFDQRRRILAGTAALSSMNALPAFAQQVANAAASQGHDHHHHHHAMPEGLNIQKANYRIPSVTLVREDGARVGLAAEMDDGRPVILGFIFTSCTAICPVISQTLSQVQDALLKSKDRFNMMSISIDPEYDTPARLTEYARKFQASSQWRHYTGSVRDIIAVQRAFHVYRGDKMNHTPVTLLRSAPGQSWVRLDGFASPDDIVAQYHKLVHAA
jgi:protein SCO1/2